MHATRSASPWTLARTVGCALLLLSTGIGLAYQDGRLHGWMTSGAAASAPETAVDETAALEEAADETAAPGPWGRTGRDGTDRVGGDPLGDDRDGGDRASSDPRRSDLRLPDLRTRPPSDVYIVDERSEGGPVRLKFTTLIWNAGAGPLEVRGDPDEADETGGGLEVEQHAVDEDGRWHPVGAVAGFDFEHRHGHLHLTGFADYELWTLPSGQPGERIAQNAKIGFCLMDNVVVDEAMAPDAPVYGTGCEADVQGISPGYGDLYVAELYEQDIDVTDVPDGRYRLVNIANPDGVLLEADAANNAGYADVELRTGADGERAVSSVP